MTREDCDPRDPESDWECPDHGPVRPQIERQHGGRSRARVCGVDGCQWTVTDTSLDWDAYHDAVENDESPPCPRCGSEDITEVPTSTPFRCGDCSHSYGYAGGYH